MKKIAIFWEKRFQNNNFMNLNLDKNLSPYLELAKYNGLENTISIDLLNNRIDKDNYIILCFLQLSISTFFQYLHFLYKYWNHKKFLFIYEPHVVSPLNYNSIFHLFFDRIYTWNDHLVDAKWYFKFLYPSSLTGRLLNNKLNFDARKLLCLINSNKSSFWFNELYSEREKFIRYAENSSLDFDLYWIWWNTPNIKQIFFGYTPYLSYKGKVLDKIEVLSQYKFNICFENMKNTPGYITEKIWDAFKARCVPIYWGASNVTDYIPENTFIDFRKYENNYQSLSSVLQNMEESEYNLYLENIEKFLKTSDAKKWFDQTWATDFLHNL